MCNFEQEICILIYVYPISKHSSKDENSKTRASFYFLILIIKLEHLEASYVIFMK